MSKIINKVMGYSSITPINEKKQLILPNIIPHENNESGKDFINFLVKKRLENPKIKLTGEIDALKNIIKENPNFHVSDLITIGNTKNENIICVTPPLMFKEWMRIDNAIDQQEHNTVIDNNILLLSRLHGLNPYRKYINNLTGNIIPLNIAFDWIMLNNALQKDHVMLAYLAEEMGFVNVEDAQINFDICLPDIIEYILEFLHVTIQDNYYIQDLQPTIFTFLER